MLIKSTIFKLCCWYFEQLYLVTWIFFNIRAYIFYKVRAIFKIKTINLNPDIFEGRELGHCELEIPLKSVKSVFFYILPISNALQVQISYLTKIIVFFIVMPTLVFIKTGKEPMLLMHFLFIVRHQLIKLHPENSIFLKYSIRIIKFDSFSINLRL